MYQSKCYRLIKVMQSAISNLSANENKGMVIIAGDCNFTLAAISLMLCFQSYHAECFRLQQFITCEVIHSKPPVALIINLRSFLAKQCSVLNSLVKFYIERMYTGPVILVTEMTQRCAWALLRMAGLPCGMGNNIYTVSSRLSPDKLQYTLRNIIAGTSTLTPVARHEFNLTPYRIFSLNSMINGLHERQQARRQKRPIKSVYNYRHDIIQKIGVSSQHAFLCGTF
ncbi:hypothetical protein ACK6WK_22130 [Citrobacter portucalensis]|uniref:hypothetical protein n=1 Tax=Citrobacter portucalensis TaxID=1639133 RepID=UPI003C30B9CC